MMGVMIPKVPPVTAFVGQKKQLLLWTALPKGITGSGGDARLRLSVFLSPRLDTNIGLPKPTLSQFPDFLDLPATVKSIQFAVQFGAGSPIPATRASPEPDSSLWKALFKDSTFVRPHKFEDYSERRIHSFPVKHVLSYLKETYQNVAITSPTELPEIQTLISPKDATVGLGPTIKHSVPQVRSSVGHAPPGVDAPLSPMKVLPQALEEEFKGRKAIPHSPVRNTPVDFLQVQFFHLPLLAKPIPPQIPEMDFHQALSSLGEYPELLRMLGLVVDLEIPYSPSIPASSTLRVIPTWTPQLPSTTNSSPWTAYEIKGGKFLAKPRPQNPEIQDGMLKLNDPQMFDLVQVDVDGAAMKVMDFARNLQRTLTFKAPAMVMLKKAGAPPATDQAMETQEPPPPQRQGLPSMRSAGLSVIRNGRADRLQQSLQSAKQRNDALSANQDITLYAEDLVRGYRVDVWDSQSNQWHSLCWRDGKYHFTQLNQDVKIVDEGMVSSAATQVPGATDSDLYVHESLFRWDGWSLCVPRPGRTINPEDKPEEIQNKAATPFGLEVNFAPVPGTLPRLRFGVSYRLRARMVDLAGNSLSLEEADASFASSSETYQRFEPVQTPILVLREKPREGESLERLVIRSFNDSPARDSILTSEAAERHIAPPKTSQLMSETHGMLEDKTTGKMKGDPATYQMLAQKDVGKFQEVEFPNPADPSKPFRYAIQSEEQLVLPYLPDPLARQASFVGLPGMPAGEVKAVDFENTPENWPNAKPFRIRLVEGSKEPKWDASQRTLLVYLPKAEVATVRLSAHLDEPDLNIFGMWQWIKEKAEKSFAPPLTESAALPPAKILAIADLTKIATLGTHWLLTPYRELVLVHAVQQPLLIPKITLLKPRRNMGDTFAGLDGRITVHGKSTIKIDLLARWSEPVDEPASPANVPDRDRLFGSVRVFEIPVQLDEKPVAVAGGTARYKESEKALILGTGVETAHSAPREDATSTGTLPPMVKPVLPGRLTDVLPALTQPPRHEFGDTKYRKVYYKALATTRFREYFPSSLTSDPKNITRESEEVEIDIPSTARPASPEVLYVIPSFGWEKKELAAGGKMSRRTGGGLRVYVKRPWWSSGDGELLGVVLQETPGFIPAGIRVSQPPAIPDLLKPYVTQWGMDPIWKSSPTPSRAAPSLEHFKNAARKASSLTLEELMEHPEYNHVSVAGYEPHYDAERKLWYFDIEVDPGDSYYPFIRLALARYQPNSIENAHLSRVVLADFAQLAPDRTVTVSYDSRDLKLLTITLAGVSYEESAAGKGPSEVEVTVETRQEGVEGDVGWIPVPDATFLLHPPSLPSPPPGKISPKVVQRFSPESSLTGVGEIVKEGITPRLPSAILLKGTVWTGQVTLPEPRGTRPFRLVIKEYEWFLADEPGEGFAPSPSVPLTHAPTPKARRLVFADAIEI